MMNVKRMKAFLLAAVMICVLVMMSACGGNNTPTGPADYKVTVLDGKGQPYTEGVIVRFLQNGEQVAMQKVDANGVATKNLERGTYTVELVLTGNASAFYYDTNNVTLTAEKTELQIVLTGAAGGEGRDLWVESAQKEYTAYNVEEGVTFLKLTVGDRAYFLFTPNRAGTYQFSVSGSNVAIGYYGAPHFVQPMNAAEVVNNTFTVSISNSMIGTGDTGTTVLVIGVDSQGAETAYLTIERTGEPADSIEDIPWTVYKKTIELSAYKLLPLAPGTERKEFDLTAASYDLVLDESTGFYHLNSVSGPIVYVRLAAASGGSKYLPDFETILENSGVCKYFYDENGNVVKRETYDECLREYIACADPENGLFPLTDDLKYIIQQRGDHYGWFDENSSGYLFIDPTTGVKILGINPDVSWLFICCYHGRAF